jgi:hypothetical protein
VVDIPGFTVFTPAVGTSPIPSIEADVAFKVFQCSSTGSPAFTEVGLALMSAVGAGVATGGAVAAGGGGAFFLQPATANKATKRNTGIKICLR